MLFGAMRILARMERESIPEVKRYDYHDEQKSFMDLLRSPMTLSQGARIMNAYRKMTRGK